MTRTTRVSTCRRWVAGVLAALVGLGPLATPSYAALTALADQPLSAQNQAKPNIVLTVDDSTSMLFDFLPDTVVQRKYCRDITGNSNALCGDFGANTSLAAQNRGKYVTPGYIFQQYGIPYGSYDPSFSTSGPGAGCDLTSVPNATCSGGFDTGPLPGLERYPNPPGPPPAKSPKAGQEYEYWTLWPAPVHNSEVNHAYYNPRLNYDPPVYADGTSYPQMNAANTTSWTRVPADPWASTIQYVDLTRSVTVGLWCNSDWNLGHEADPAYCRTNGTGPSAATAWASTTDGDYNYPWAPPGISPGNGPTTAKSIAWSKVDSATHAIMPAWATAQDPKYFYENDNILWCDSTSPLWPHQGPTTPQTCVGGSVRPQVCNGATDQTCTAGASQTCVGVTPQTCAGQQSQTCGNITGQVCNNPVTQVCNGVSSQSCGGVTPQSCQGQQSQTCNNIGAQTCNNAINQVCNGATSQTCGGVTPQTCGGQQPQTCQNIVTQVCNNPITQVCNGVQSQTCNGIGNQTCAGITSQTCDNIIPQTCGNYSTQTCNNVVTQVCNLVAPVCVPPDPATCTTEWNDPIHCPCAGPECDECHLVTTCPPGTCSSNGASCASAADCPSNGTCSSTLAACTNNAQCPQLHGTCAATGDACFTNAECPQLGTCSSNVLAVCRNNGECPTIAGHCSIDNSSCLSNASCPNEGHCSIVGNICTIDAQCPTQAGQCSVTNAACVNNGQCPDTVGSCSTNHNACINNSQCPIIPGTCNIDNQACTTNTDCLSAGQCSVQNNVCHNDTQCPTVAGQCSTSHAGCLIDANCPTLPGQCTVTNAGCFDNTQCPDVLGVCSGNNQACANNAQCPTIPGACSVNNQACTVNADCPVAGRCSINNAACQSDPQCPLIPGQCTSTFAACTVDANCPTLPGQCTVTHAGCFDNSGCPPTAGACSVNNQACIDNSQCPIIPGACNIDNLACTTNADCPSAGQCTVQHNTCHSDAECPTVPGQCTSSHASCTGDAKCPTLAGHCSISNAGCFDDSACPNVGQHCSVTGESCSATPYYPICQWDFVTTCAEPSYCPIVGGTCSIDGNPCQHFFFALWWELFHFAYDLAYCPAVVTVGQCSIDQSNCYYDFQCQPTNGPSASAVCSDKLSDNSKSLLEDANGTGVVCRHNNKTYGATLASRYNYPDAKYNTPVTTPPDPITGAPPTGPNACIPSTRYANVPRHYWKTGVEWCDRQIATPADKWLGYGTPTGGSCQDSQDATHLFPRFYQFGQAPGTDNYAIPGFQRIDLDITQPTATYVHNWKDDDGTPQSITRTFGGATPDASEMTNYANWFAYYRTRITAVKTVTSLAFKDIDTKYRLGFHTLSNGAPNRNDPPQSDPALFVNIDDFGTAQKAAWYAQLFRVAIPLGLETPSLSALVRIGEYYRVGTHPELVGSTDPIVLSCQKNHHMLFTDGYTNENGLPSIPVGDQDDIVPAYPEMGPKPINGLEVDKPFPNLYREDAANLNGASNSLSDYAMHYWITDLRPTMPNNVPTPQPPLDMFVGDPASWQHQNFAALSLGTSGKLPARNPTTTEAQLKAGSLQWPKPWPTVNKPDNSGVDDLWHAAINGHGQFVNAEAVQDLRQGIGQILADALNQAGTRAGVGFISNTFGASANIRYQVGFVAGWAGTVTKVEIDPKTGQPVAVNPIQWDAAAQLAAQLTIVPVTKPTPWFSERKIVTMSQTGAKVPFLWANLGANQRDSLAPGNALLGQAILEYLRGNPLREGPKVGQLRQRKAPLGDVVDSSAVYVGPPNLPYLDGNDPGYSGFKTTFGAREKRIYAGANDGMLHVFDDATGKEAWAYIPTPLFRGGTAGGDFRAGLGALALQDGAIPAFRHHFYVDSTPKVVDVDFGARDWRTVLVGGLGKGGNRYYALDITQPAAITTEAAAATKILWEFPPVGDTATDMGYSYGKPIIAKTHEFGWTAIVASGYNNPSGVGKLYFLNISDAAIRHSMSTGKGSAGTPSGLAHPAGYTKDYRNQLVEQIYGGDLLGNFWRFDVSAASAASWGIGQLASLVDSVGAAQPVTTPPEIKIDFGNVDRWVFVGTGKLLDDSDLQIPNPPQQQTFYAFRDGSDDAPWALPATPVSRTTVGMLKVSRAEDESNGLANKPDKGWFDDLPVGQRIVVPPQAALGVVAYIATRAQTDPCLTGLPVTIYARDYTTGKSLLTENADDGTGNLKDHIDDEAGGVGLQIVSFEAAPGATVPDVRIAITHADGTVRYIKPKLPAILLQHRMSWRLLGQ